MEAGHRVSKLYCCVVGCRNSYANTSKEIKFYTFPNRSYEEERKKFWINNIRRKSPCGKSWFPKRNDRICSAHFVGNCKSNLEHSLSYNPTIFSKEYNTTKSSSESTAQSNVDTTALIKRSNAFAGAATSHVEKTKLEVLTSNAECQVNFDLLTDDACEKNFLFECDFSKENNDVAVQANIIYQKNLTHSNSKCVGNSDDIKCWGFHGRESITNDQEMSSLGGVSITVFNLFLSFLTVEHGNDKLSKENKLLLFFMKMKLGISYCALSVFFNLHSSSVSRIFINILNELVQKANNFVYWPSREVVYHTLPKAFLLNYPHCRVIIDCSEVKVEQPRGVNNQVYTYSNYKGTFTAKFLLGIAPNGFVSFISKCYGGRATDSFITNDCGLLDLLEPNDQVLADKGFPNINCKEDVIVVMPPFLHNGMLSLEEVEKTYSVASVRIHVERSIQRIKTYKILDKIPHNLFPYIDKVVRMCAILTNLQPPTIYDDDSST